MVDTAAPQPLFNIGLIARLLLENGDDITRLKIVVQLKKCKRNCLDMIQRPIVLNYLFFLFFLSVLVGRLDENGQSAFAFSLALLLGTGAAAARTVNRPLFGSSLFLPSATFASSTLHVAFCS